jgi:glycogenin glucosyltransferase
MQYITIKFSGSWHNIDLRYSSFNGYPNVDVLYGIHFAGLKPWSIQNKSVASFAKFADYKLWHHTFLRMMKDYPTLSEIGKLRRITAYLLDLRSDPRYQVRSEEYPLIPHFFQ